jgi:cyclopropane-fatty-acyl-phospholipid synthase
MIEAVPAKHYPDFVNCCDRALKPGGRVVMQVIHAFAFNNSVARSRDPTALGTFVTTHIFPGQQIPNLDFLQEAFIKNGNFKRVYSETTGHDYAQTLREWRLRLDGPSKDGFVIPDKIQRKYR